MKKVRRDGALVDARQFTVPLTPEEIAALRDLAKKWDRTLGDTIAMAVDIALCRRSRAEMRLKGVA